MGQDHSIHIERCSRDFQREFHPLMLKKNTAVRAVWNRPNSQTKMDVLELNREIHDLINGCWWRSGENYVEFEYLFDAVIDDVEDKIYQMEEAVDAMRERERAQTLQAPQRSSGHGGGGSGYQNHQSYHQHQHLHYHEAPFPDRHRAPPAHSTRDPFVGTRMAGGKLHDIYEGPRGGHYYINSLGDKRYI